LNFDFYCINNYSVRFVYVSNTKSMLDQKLFTPTTATEKITVFYTKINRHMFINVIFSAILKNPHQDNQEYRILFSPPLFGMFRLASLSQHFYNFLKSASFNSH